MDVVEKSEPVRHVTDLGADELAGTYQRNPLDFPAPDAELLKRFDEQGFVIIENLLTHSELNTAIEGVQACLGPKGRNDFEGFATQRAYALLAKTRKLDHLAAHPLVMGFLQARLHAEPLLSACLAIHIHPGETQQLPHHDDGFYQMARPHPPIGLSVIWALEEFKIENGATRVWPGSQVWQAGRTPTDDDPDTYAVMPAGSAIIFNSAIWHCGGANNSDETRMGLTMQYCQPYLRQQENMTLSVPPEIVRDLPAPIPSLLGYQIVPPFMGHVNGLHPNRLLES